MTTESVVVPALSTHQDESTFEFAKVCSEEVIRTHLGLANDATHNQVIERIKEYYNVSEICNFLRQKVEIDGGESVPKYRHITLQFPDSLICDSATIVHELQRELGLVLLPDYSNESKYNSNSCCKEKESDFSPSQKLWILADTSYSECCIDEVAAGHVNSDLVIHFGDACLNVVESLPAAYVFGKPNLNLDTVVTQFKKTYANNRDLKILLMANAPHTQYLGQLYTILKPDYPNLAYADLYLDSSSNATIIGYNPCPSQSSKLNVLNRTIIGLENNNEEIEIDTILANYDLFHIEIPAIPRLLQLTTTFQSVTTFHPEAGLSSQGPYPKLMRRYRYMHMARSAGTVGLLVNTLSLANTKTLINKIGQKIKEAGKKHYLFVVGKPNVAKLANFENIDIWCVLGCDHQGIIIDQNNEYYKPIVTPYELLLALSKEQNWTGKWVTDFNKVLEDMNLEEKRNEQEINDGSDTSDKSSDDEAPEFNPVTGQYVSTSKPLRKLQHLQISSQEQHTELDNDGSQDLVKKFSTAVAIKDTVSTSAMHLQTRHWTGLGSDFQRNDSDEEENENGALVEDGRAGIARGYDYDREIKYHGH
mmetsp:Transcript_1632/g.1956  ORF Transcript_1632/g.1956 Transcript_1632/m.1956 type:complete len:591 (-) Transcript_1632:17-1789(-)